MTFAESVFFRELQYYDVAAGDFLLIVRLNFCLLFIVICSRMTSRCACAWSASVVLAVLSFTLPVFETTYVEDIALFSCYVFWCFLWFMVLSHTGWPKK